MTQDYAEKEFEDIVLFDSPVPSNNKGVRMVDREAGIVLYGLTGKQGVGLSTVPVDDTDLD